MTTVYIGNHFEWTGSAATMVKYYYAGGQRVAMRKGTGAVTYLFGDHLGSTSITTNSNGTLATEQRYYPWGGTRYGSSPTAFQYTGQRNDSYIKLYSMGARMYDPELGRFISPDSIVPDFGDPQSLNRYSYVVNNPLKYRDPTGHWFETALDIAGIIWDIHDIKSEGLNFWTGAALTVDVVCLVLPVATGGGAAVRAVSHADDVVDAAKAINRADDVADAARAMENTGDILEAVDNGDEVIAGGAETYRAVSDNWPFNWKPTKGDIAGNPAGLSCSVGCEGMSHQEIFEMSVGRSAESGDHLYTVNTKVLQDSKFGLTPDPLSSNPYHAVTGGSQVGNWTKPIAREFKDMWQLIWSYVE